MARKAYAMDPGVLRSDPFMAKLAAIPADQLGSMRSLFAAHVGVTADSTVKVNTSNSFSALTSWVKGVGINFLQARSAGLGIFKSVGSVLGRFFVSDLTPTQQIALARILYVQDSGNSTALKTLQQHAETSPDAFLSQITPFQAIEMAAKIAAKEKTPESKSNRQKIVNGTLTHLRKVAEQLPQETADFSISREGKLTNSPMTITIVEASKKASGRVAALAQASIDKNFPITVRFAGAVAKDSQFVSDIKNQVRVATLRGADLYWGFAHGRAVPLGLK